MPLSKRRREESLGEDDDAHGTDRGTSSDAERGSKAKPTECPNTSHGFCRIPTEVTLEILSHLPAVDNSSFNPCYYADRGSRKRQRTDGILPTSHQARTHALRALCGTCKVFHKMFYPILWGTLDICFPSRSEKGELTPDPFHKAIGETMLRKCKGLLENEKLASLVKTVNVVFTRHKMEKTLPTFVRCLRLMPNLHTLHVLEANPQMPKGIKTAFEGVDLPSVRTVIVPNNCQELLKSCPNVERVWCNHGKGDKLVTAIRMFCKHVREVRGFRCEEDANAMKAMVNGLPDLQVLELYAPMSEDVIRLLPMLKKLSKVDVRISVDEGEEAEEYRETHRTIKSIAAVLLPQTEAPEITALIPEDLVDLFTTLKRHLSRVDFRISRGAVADERDKRHRNLAKGTVCTT